MVLAYRLALRAFARRVALAALLFPLFAILASPAMAGGWTIVYSGTWSGASTPPCDANPVFGSNHPWTLGPVTDTGSDISLNPGTLSGEFMPGHPGTFSGTVTVQMTWDPDPAFLHDPPPTSVWLDERMTLGAEVALHQCAIDAGNAGTVSSTWEKWGCTAQDTVVPPDISAVHTKTRRISLPVWHDVNSDGTVNNPPDGQYSVTFDEPFTVTVNTPVYPESCTGGDCTKDHYSAFFHLDFKAFLDGEPGPGASIPRDLPPYQSMDKRSSGDPVNLATGTEDYAAPADIEVYNPSGPDVVYQRVYHSMRAIEHLDKPSLCGYAAGWVDNYDIRIQKAPPNRDDIKGYGLVYPNGSVDDLGAGSSSSTGSSLIRPEGVPYIVEGKPKSPDYQPITVTWKDLTKWTFDYCANKEVYLLCHITDAMGHSLNIERGPTNDAPLVPVGAISVIRDVASQTSLLTFHYDGTTPAPTSIEDCNGRVVHYGYTQDTTTGDYLLTSVQPIGADANHKWAYQYQSTPAYSGIDAGNLLTKISRPAPTGTGLVETTIEYESSAYYANGVYRVKSTTDSKNNKIEYSYTNYSLPSPPTAFYELRMFGLKFEATHVTVKDGGGNVVREYVAYSDPFTYKTLGSFESGRYSVVGYEAHPVGPLVCSPLGCGTVLEESPYPTSSLDESGNLTTYTWDDYGNLTSSRCESPGGGLTPPVTKQKAAYSYSSAGFPYLASVTCQYGDGSAIDSGAPNPVTWTTYNYDPISSGVSGNHNLLTSVQQADPSRPSNNPGPTTTSFTYDGLGNVRTITGRDASNNIIRKAAINYPGTIAAPTSKRPSSVSVNTVVADNDPNNPPITTYFNWNGDGTLLTAQDAAGSAADYSYSADHLVQSIVQYHAGSPAQNVSDTVFDFDHVGGDLKSVGVHGYTAGSPLVSGVNYSYDAAGALNGVTGDTEEFSRSLDPLGRIASLTDGASHTTNYGYAEGPPAAGSPSNVTATDSASVSYPLHGTGSYDHGSATDTHATQYNNQSQKIARSVAVTDGNGVVRTFVYGAGGGALSDVTYSSALAANNLHFEYDVFGHVKVRVHGSCGANWQAAGANYQDIELYTYDPDGRVLTATTRYPGLTDKTIAYTYHPDGTRAAMTVTGCSQAFTYTYNLAGQMTGMYNPTAGSNGNYGWTYDAAGRLKSQTLGTAVSTQYGYDSVGRLNWICNFGWWTSDYSWNSSTWFYSTFQGARDAVGNLTSMQVTYNANLQPQDWNNNPGNSCFIGTRTYTYHPVGGAHPYGRLYSETSDASIGYSNAFAYDDAGNLTSCRGIGGYNPITTEFNPDNQISAFDGYNAGDPLTYDGNGNPAVRAVWGSIEGDVYRIDIPLGFDVENRLTTYNGYTFAGYRGDGLRAWKQDQNGARTYFIYDGGVPVAEYNSSGTLTAVNVFGANGLVARWTNDHGCTHYVFDLKGNIAQYAYQNGTYNNADYDAFGLNYVDGNGQPVPIPLNEPWGFGAQWGYYTDNETQNSEGGVSALVLCGYRYYDPHTGRWLTRDPIGYDGGINLYAFCGNDPVNFADPWGTLTFRDAWRWYIGGMGGLSPFVDKYLMGGTTEEFGTSVGVYESGCGSLGQVLWSGTKFTGQLVYNAMSIADGVKALSSIPSALKTAACFVAGTNIVMADGSTKPIEQIKEGDLVLSRDQHDDASGKVVAKKVLKTSVRQAPATLTLTLTTGEKIECTPEHPFYVAGRGFVEAKDLGIGTSIVTRAGPAVQVANVERHDAPATVYNFVVEDTHTYFVGAANGGVEVHNVCDPTSVYRAFDDAGNVIYVGITNDIERRGIEQAGRFEIEELIGNLSRADARGVEQALIEEHVLSKNGGTLLNKINSIAADNPIYANAAQRGRDILAGIGY